MKRLKFLFILVAVFAFMFAVFPPQTDQIEGNATLEITGTLTALKTAPAQLAGLDGIPAYADVSRIGNYAGLEGYVLLVSSNDSGGTGSMDTTAVLIVDKNAGDVRAKSLVDETDLFANYLYGGTHPEYSAPLRV